MSQKITLVNIRSVCSLCCRFGLAMLAGLVLALILPAGVARAVPVAPDEVQLTQPDGTVIVASPFGDEWYSGYEHQGYTILLDGKSKYWVYASQDRNGALIAGQRKAGIDAPLPGLARHLRDSQVFRPWQPERSPLAPEVWPGASGTQKVLIILVDFTPSVSRGTTDTQWNQLFFDGTSGVKSVRNFYRQASYNQFDLEPANETYGTANDGVIAVTLDYAHPNSYPTDVNNRWITRNALVAADSDINYGSFDTNGNGALDGTELHLVIVARGFETSYGGTSGSCTPRVWGHRGALYQSDPAAPPTLDGVVVGDSEYDHGYTQVGEWHEFSSDGCDGSYPGHMATVGIMIHEMGHDIDWPDLYDTDGGSAGVGNWSIMSGGSWGRASSSEFIGTTPTLPDVFLKWYQGWLTPVQVTTPQTGVSLANSAQNPVAYLLGTNPDGVDWDFRNASGTGEYFLIENRQQVGFDAGLWRIDSAGNAHGCLIWHIDETRTSANTANADPARKLVDVEEAEDIQDMDTNTNSGDLQDFWPGTTARTAFSGASTPNTNWYDGSASGIAISNISTSGTGCTVDFTSVGPAWDGSESSNWDTANNWTVGRVPNQYDNTVIPAGVPNWPDVNAAASVGNLNILSGAHLNATANVSLDVYGNWSEAGSGYFDASAGTVAFRGPGPQAIASGASSHFNHLQIGNGSTSQMVTAASDLDVNGNLSVQAGAKLDASSHTIRVAGNWTDNPFGFVPGSGTVILDGTTQAVQRAASELVVYSNNLASTAGWSIYDANADGWPWYYSTSTNAPNSTADNHGQHARYQKNFDDSNVAADDWLFSPGFVLQAGVTYTVRFNYGARSASYPEKLAVHIGSAQAVGAMTTQVFDNNNVINTTWQQGSGTFTPGSTGTYYMGFHCYSAANKYQLAIDDLEVAAPDPNLVFYNLSVANGSTVALGDHAAVQNDLAVNAGGKFEMGAYHLTVEGSVANNGALAQTRTVNGDGTAFLNIKNAAATVDKYLGATIDPGSSNMGSTTVTIWGNQLCPGASFGVKRCFDLAPTTAQTAAVTFYYAEAERNGVGNSAMLVYHWSGTDWDQETGTFSRGGSGDGQWVRVTGVDAYSPFSLNSDSPTAATMAGFSGVAMGDGSVSLGWQTVSELDLLGFYLYRATSETDTPQRLNEDLIPAQWPGSPTGGSYSFHDQSTLPGATYSYWIDVVQIDGTVLRYGPVNVAVMPLGGLKLYFPLILDAR